MNTVHDLIVIGSGPGGYRTALLAALRGLDVAIVERAEWGGCCLNRGCVPKKAWHRTARLLADQENFFARGIRGHLSGDLDAAWRHQREIVAELRDSYTNYLQRLGVSRLEGHARLLSTRRVEVEGSAGLGQVEARHIVIASGSKPAIPPMIELMPGRVITTDMLFEQPPPTGKRAAILGSGVAATELAFILAKFCGHITWLGRSPSLQREALSMPARQALTEALDQSDVRLRLAGAGISIEDQGSNGLAISLDDGAAITADWLCVATGRRPVSEDLGLEKAGVEIDDAGFIIRNAYLETSAPGIFAIGDCASRHMSANHALAEAAVAVENILRGNRRREAPDSVPTVVYSALEIGRVGLDEHRAEQLGLEPAVGFAAFDTNPCAAGRGHRQGFVRVLADLDTGRLLGGEIVGQGAAELINILGLAPDPDRALAWIAAGRYNHPTMGEELLNATETLAQRWGLGNVVFGD